MSHERTIDIVDIGTGTIVVIAASVDANDTICIEGWAEVPSVGIAAGSIVDIQSAFRAIAVALETAASHAGRPIRSVTIGISGDHIESTPACIDVPIEGRTVTDADMRMAVDALTHAALPKTGAWSDVAAFLHTYMLDHMRAVTAPVGFEAHTLTCSGLIAYTQAAIVSELKNRLKDMAIDVRHITLQHYAAARGVLTHDELHAALPFVVIDIGSGTTDSTWIHNGIVRRIAHVPVGGNAIDDFLFEWWRIPMQMVRDIKHRYAAVSASAFAEADATLFDSSNRLYVQNEDIRCADFAVQFARVYDDILLAPVRTQIADMAREIDAESGIDSTDDAEEDAIHIGGIVCTGGGAQPACLDEHATQFFDVPVRIGNPITDDIPLGTAPFATDPSYAVAVGLLRIAAEHAQSAPKQYVRRDMSEKRSWFDRLYRGAS